MSVSRPHLGPGILYKDIAAERRPEARGDDPWRSRAVTLTLCWHPADSGRELILHQTADDMLDGKVQFLNA